MNICIGANRCPTASASASSLSSTSMSSVSCIFILKCEPRSSRFNSTLLDSSGRRKNYEKESTRTRQLKNEIITFSNTESDLRQQLNVYVDKFKQV